jgi:hypothetical protein
VTRVWRVVILGGMVAASVIGPALAGGVDQVDAQCRAYFGSRNDGICIDGPDQPTPNFPFIGVGPTGNGPGLTTGPLLPGQTIGGQIPLA